MRSIFLVMATASLSACTYSLGPPMSQVPQPVQAAAVAPAPKPFVSPYKDMDTGGLCQAYRDPAVDPRVRSTIEVELVLRGEKFCNGSNIGMASLIKMGRSRYDRIEAAPAGASNCGKFASGAAAQQAFLAAGGPEVDPQLLDRDGDGLACGWGEDLKWIATASPS
jgi:hypothetical protein